MYIVSIQRYLIPIFFVYFLRISFIYSQLDSWSVILNGSVEIVVDSEETTFLHLGDSFGVEPSVKKMYHKGVMKTRVDDCQVSCACI